MEHKQPETFVPKHNRNRNTISPEWKALKANSVKFDVSVILSVIKGAQQAADSDAGKQEGGCSQRIIELSSEEADCCLFMTDSRREL